MSPKTEILLRIVKSLGALSVSFHMLYWYPTAQYHEPSCPFGTGELPHQSKRMVWCNGHGDIGNKARGISSPEKEIDDPYYLKTPCVFYMGKSCISTGIVAEWCNGYATQADRSLQLSQVSWFPEMGSEDTPPKIQWFIIISFS